MLFPILAISGAAVLIVGVQLHKRLHQSVEQRLGALFDRIRALEALPKSDPSAIVPPAIVPPTPKKRASRAKKA